MDRLSPRKLALEIDALKTADERRSVLDRVPAELRRTVEFYVLDWRWRRNRGQNPKLNRAHKWAHRRLNEGNHE